MCSLNPLFGHSAGCTDDVTLLIAIRRHRESVQGADMTVDALNP